MLKFKFYRSNIHSLNHLGSCPSGYSPKSGDVPGWGSISSNPLVLTVNDCSYLCNKDASCCSFEYSSTTKVCNLNKECEPSQGPFQDFIFCSPVQEGRLMSFSWYYCFNHINFIHSLNHLGECPYGYSPKSGDVPGWGSISKNPRIATVNECSSLCNRDESCCSFEYSSTTQICNLNRECDPTQGPFEDYIFWSKDQGWCPLRVTCCVSFINLHHIPLIT